MVACLAMVIGEASPGPLASDGLAATSPAEVAVASLSMGVMEAYRARRGWVAPDSTDAVFAMRDSYYPGDLGLDPLGVRPAGGDAFQTAVAHELNVGRMAMLGVAGMVAQEAATHETVSASLARLLDA